MVYCAQAVGRNDDYWQAKIEGQVSHSLAFGDGDEQAPGALDKQDIAILDKLVIARFNLFKFNGYAEMLRCCLRRDGQREPVRVYDLKACCGARGLLEPQGVLRDELAVIVSAACLDRFHGPDPVPGGLERPGEHTGRLGLAYAGVCSGYEKGGLHDLNRSIPRNLMGCL